MGAYRYDRLKVLVVDDNQHMRKLVSSILQAFGIKTVLEAASGEEAWKTLLINPCDVVFADWVMEGMTGLELTQKIRTAPETPNAFIPVIIVTGFTSLDKLRIARDGGVNEFLAKPVSPKTILSRLSAVIENPRSFVRTKSYFGPCRRRLQPVKYHGPERRVEEANIVTPGGASANAA